MLTTFSSCGKFTRSSKGKGWNVLGTSPSGIAFDCLAVDSNGIIYASGWAVNAISSVPVTQLGMYDPTTSTWTSIASGVNDRIWVMVVDSNNNLYISGDFTVIGTTTVNYIAKWDGSTWSALGTGANVGANNSIRCLACDSENNVYVGGGFTKVGNTSINATRVAKYTVSTSTWSAFGSGITLGNNINVEDICVDTNFNVYVSGWLDGYGHAARWNGTNWSALGGGLSSYVGCITCDSNNNIYVSGGFNSANGLTVKQSFAMWNGTVWSDLGTSSISGLVQVNARCIKIGADNKLYIGTQNGRVFVYDGSTWTLLKTFDNQIKGMHVDSELNIYATGFFRIDNKHSVVKYN
jgi:hypothetical protein